MKVKAKPDHLIPPKKEILSRNLALTSLFSAYRRACFGSGAIDLKSETASLVKAGKLSARDVKMVHGLFAEYMKAILSDDRERTWSSMTFVQANPFAAELKVWAEEDARHLREKAINQAIPHLSSHIEALIEQRYG
jgi:hypothetical protein